MANQMNVNRYRFVTMMDLDCVARLRTYIKGKTVPNLACGGRKARKATRPMKLSDAVEIQVRELTKDVKIDAESRQWMMAKYAENVKNRKAADSEVRAGLYRKPKSEWRKPGRVKGKEYPKCSEANKRIWAKKSSEAMKKMWAKKTAAEKHAHAVKCGMASKRAMEARRKQSQIEK